MTAHGGGSRGAERRILFALYAHPAAFPPVERAAQILREAGWRVRIVGARGLETDALAGAGLEGLDVRLTSRAGSGLAQKLRYGVFCLACLLHLLRWRPRWVYVSDSFSTPVGVIAAMFGFSVVYHEHDAPTDPRPSRFVRGILRARRSLLRRARLVVTPNEERSRAIASEAGEREVLTVWNCPRRAEIREHRSRAQGAALRLVYHGSIGRDRPPIPIVDAMAKVGDAIELEVAGYETVGSRGLVAALRRRAEELGIADRVQTNPPMPRAKLLERASDADLGVSFMPTRDSNFNELTMAGASNKAFEYLACGVPLFVSDLPDWRRMFVDRGVAIAADPSDVGRLTEGLRWAAANREELARMGRRGQDLIATEWNYETRFRIVQERLEAPFIP